MVDVKKESSIGKTTFFLIKILIMIKTDKKFDTFFDRFAYNIVYGRGSKKNLKNEKMKKTF